MAKLFLPRDARLQDEMYRWVVCVSTGSHFRKPLADCGGVRGE